MTRKHVFNDKNGSVNVSIWRKATYFVAVFEEKNKRQRQTFVFDKTETWLEGKCYLFNLGFVFCARAAQISISSKGWNSQASMSLSVKVN